MIFHVVMSVYWLVKIWNSPQFPDEFRNGLLYIILYACVTMVLDSNGPIIKLKFMSLKQKRTAQNCFGSGQMYVLSILIISTTKGCSEHTNSQYSLAWMFLCMATCTFVKRLVFQTSVFVQNMTWKGIEFCQNYTPRFLFQIRNWPRMET